MNLLLWTVFLIGHVSSWCVVYNRTHATAWPRKTRKQCEKAVIVAVLVLTAWFLYRCISTQTIDFWEIQAPFSAVENIYLLAATGMGLFFISRWTVRKLKPRPKAVAAHSHQIIDLQKEIGRNVYLTPLARALKKIPFNHAHVVAVESIDLVLEKLPAVLEELRICQLSDLHLTGQIDRQWFEKVVEKTNALEPDIVLITGDLIDELQCLDWIETVFGLFNAKHGTFFVRGNHDLRIGDQKALLERLESAGMTWVGGQFLPVNIDGVEVLIAGNELPWHTGAEALAPDSVRDDCFKILLTHTPDQIDWAKPFAFDLIFAGHNHGGQIRFPLIGPIVAPSKYGVLYASGTFEVDGSILHVSRGLSGDECIRINCPPEIGCFTLRKA
jgi:predicted MPP superfamily phosphohydrolase